MEETCAAKVSELTAVQAELSTKSRETEVQLKKAHGMLAEKDAAFALASKNATEQAATLQGQIEQLQSTHADEAAQMQVECGNFEQMTKTLQEQVMSAS
jgi:hypothetical protein